MKKRNWSFICSALLMMQTACLAYGMEESTEIETEQESMDFCYQDITDVTIDTIIESMTISTILEKEDGLTALLTYSGPEEDKNNGATVTITYGKDEDYMYAGKIMEFPYGYRQVMYFSTDEEDPYVYYTAEDKSERQYLEIENIEEEFNKSLNGYEILDARLEDIYEDEDFFATINIYYFDDLFSTDVLTIDPKTGYVTNIETSYTYSEEVITTTLTYGPAEIDASPKDEYVEPELSSFAGLLTEDINGEEFTFDDLYGARLIMVNFWEPWCGPCVMEMPELEKLYETYQEEGFVILGVFADVSEKQEAMDIIDDIGITYPIVICNKALADYQTGYVPTTIFLDGEGNLISQEPVIGANSYENWEKMILEFLEED